MPAKHFKCCCCPECFEKTSTCCGCTCHSLCVHFTPDDYDEYTGECPIQSVEVDFDEQINGYSGTLAGYDFYYYFERDEYGVCWFKLRSDALGFPEGYEQAWEIGTGSDYTGGSGELTCRNLSTCVTAPELTSGSDPVACTGGEFCTECVDWITPTNCTTCQCLCECLCVYMTVGAMSCWGKACWDEYEQAYAGELTCMDEYGEEITRTISIPIRPYGEVCDPGSGCDPYDTSCAIGVIIDDGTSDEIQGEWQLMTGCEWRALNNSWNIEQGSGEDSVEVVIRCATCYETCELLYITCCENPLPRTLYASISEACSDGGFTVPLAWSVFADPDDEIFNGTGFIGYGEDLGGPYAYRSAVFALGTDAGTVYWRIYVAPCQDKQYPSGNLITQWTAIMIRVDPDTGIYLGAGPDWYSDSEWTEDDCDFVPMQMQITCPIGAATPEGTWTVDITE